MLEPLRAVPTYEAVDAYVEEQLRRARIPGLVLGVVRDGRTVHLAGFGRADRSGRPFTARTPFPVGSVSKSFTALAVMQLVEADKVDLDAPVQEYIPWFRVADTEASARMTVRHLLNQTSGLSEAAGKAALLDPGRCSGWPGVFGSRSWQGACDRHGAQAPPPEARGEVSDRRTRWRP